MRPHHRSDSRGEKLTRRCCLSTLAMGVHYSGEEAKMTLLRAVAILACWFIPSLLFATPIRFHVNMSVSSIVGHPLDGANVELDITWNPATIVPLQHSQIGDRWLTVWPTTNSQATVKVSGSASIDGVYAAQFAPSPTVQWMLGNDVPAASDTVTLPVVAFSPGASPIYITQLTASLSGSFFDGTGVVYPKPFADGQATWSVPYFQPTNPVAVIPAGVVSGFAVVMPEPATAGLLCMSLLAVAAYRRRVA